VKPNALQATHAERRERVVVLQVPEFALDGASRFVQRSEAVAITRYFAKPS